MLVRYIGSGPDDNRECVVFGLTFEMGEWVELETVPPKLLKNPTFEVADPLDHDGDGRKGGRRKKAQPEPTVEAEPAAEPEAEA